MSLHAKHAADQGHQTVVIKSPDTDVEVLACYFQSRISSKLIICSGTKQRSRLISISDVTSRLCMSVCNALPGLHALTGCDSSEVLYPVKGK